VLSETEFKGDGGDMRPQLLNKGDTISFVPPIFCDKKYSCTNFAAKEFERSNDARDREFCKI